tara:strand:- start:4867 stop:5022 length:156 start_codon:yes stop_codon:yes gene_type:complete
MNVARAVAIKAPGADLAAATEQRPGLAGQGEEDLVRQVLEHIPMRDLGPAA